MNEDSVTVANFDRLAKALMESRGVTYNKARTMLSSLRLGLIAGDDIYKSTSYQAALLTAINSGKRAFRGGVLLSLPPNVPLLLPWPGETALQSVAVQLGARVTSEASDAEHLITFANPGQNVAGLNVVCDGWRAGVFPAGIAADFQSGPDSPLGGVLAGGIAVGKTFLRASGISNREITAPFGLSLWRPDQPWLSAKAIGPYINMLPGKLWLLGLGHLGQAFAWTAGLLGSPAKQPLLVYLQDYDESESGNWSAGLLCEDQNIGEMKTRMVSRWLEQRGFKTRIIERPFDQDIHCSADEPRVALCGFDNAESRRFLELAGYDLIVDVALGGDVNRFDRMVIRTFPDAKEKASEIYAASAKVESIIRPELFDVEDEECGILFEDLAGKAVSSSFVGAAASAIATAEVIKGLHAGMRTEFLSLQLRDDEEPAVALLDEQYQLRIARNGFAEVK